MSIKFADLNLDKNILSALTSAGYESPTPIQAQSVPVALEGRDIMASAQTGSGKTAAFLLPTLQRLTRRSEKSGKGPRALVLTPTRELAAQVEKNALTYAQNMKWFRTVSIVGGASFGYQTRALSKPVDLIVATPGRLMDLMQSGKVDFDRLEVLILDEANDWFPDLADMEAKITPKTKAIVVINPNNPTGAVYSKEILLEIVELARKHGLIIFADEIYDKILYDDAVHHHIAALAPDLLTITFNGLSKAYRVAGFRQGWMVLNGPKQHAKGYIEGLDMLASMHL